MLDGELDTRNEELAVWDVCKGFLLDFWRTKNYGNLGAVGRQSTEMEHGSRRNLELGRLPDMEG